MGKIRVKSFGDQELEEKEKRRQAKRTEQKEQKKLKDAAEKGEEGQIPEETKPEESKEEVKKEAKAQKKRKPAKEGFRSAKYKEKLALVDRTKVYPLSEAVKLLSDAHMAAFDETVELHLNTLTTGISGTLTLPHGSGKKTRVAIASDELIAEVEKGKINFDVLLTHPSMMPKLAKVAKFLGPRGLMPNPKSGTISEKPEEIAKKFEGGLMSFKTEAKAPIIHMVIGKLSFGPDKLSENITTAISAIKKSNIKNVTLKSTMSPGIKLQL